MRNFYYALRQVIRFKWMNFVKLLSLTLGITIGGLLFTYVAFMQSYDSFLPDADRLYGVNVRYNYSNATDKRQDITSSQLMAPVVPKLVELIPDIEAGTRLMNAGQLSIRAKENVYVFSGLLIDSSFFDVLGFDVIAGDPHKDFSNPGQGAVYLTQYAAQTMFPDQDPLGQEVHSNGYTFTVRGIVRDVPQNCHLQFQVLAPLFNPRNTFDGGDSYPSYIKLKKGADTLQLNEKINNVLSDYIDKEKETFTQTHFTVPITKIFVNKVKDTNLIMTILAFIMIAVAGLNYALMALSSLASRAKEVGVHKASGASPCGVFALIMWETVIYTVMASVVSAVFIWAGSDAFENFMGGSVVSVFSLGNLWAVGVVLLSIIVVAGILPAALFARIPVSQIFMRYTESRNMWKRALLFVQFASATFVLCFLIVIVKQYNTLIYHDLGYSHEKLGYIECLSDSNLETTLIKSELEKLTFVDQISVSYGMPIMIYSGMGIGATDGSNNNMFSSRSIGIDSAFINTYQLKIITGDSVMHNMNDIIVNQAFLRTAGVKGNPLECSFIVDGIPATIVGVVKDFQIHSLKNAILPLVMYRLDIMPYDDSRVINIKFNSLSAANANKVNKLLKDLIPQKGYKMKIYDDQLRQSYQDALRMRNGVLAATIILIVITLMGVIGYLATEIRRRSKEIAVRKIHGASALWIIYSMSRSIVIIALIASIVGVASSYYIAQLWQSEFALKTPLAWWIFTLGVGGIIAIVIACGTLLTWHIANSNPARSIKSE